MAWENNLAYILIMNVIVGNIAYLLCKLLIKIAKMHNGQRLIYNMLKGVAVFFVVPFPYIFGRFIKGTRFTGYATGYSGNREIAKVFHIVFLIWFVGALIVCLYYLQRYRWIRKLCVNNIPYENEQISELFYQLYPESRLKKVRVYQNFLVNSSCVIGVVHPKLLIPERDYKQEDLRIMLAHEATHVIHKDNLWKGIGLAIVIANWWNPLIYAYLKDWAAWSEYYCDIKVCERFLGGNVHQYVVALLRASVFPGRESAAWLSPFAGKYGLVERITTLSKWKKKRRCAVLGVILGVLFVAGTTMTAIATGQVTSNVALNAYLTTLESSVDNALTEAKETTINLDVVDNVMVYELSAEEVTRTRTDETSATSSVVPFNWKIDAGNIGTSIGFVKFKDKEISVNTYIASSTGPVRIGIIRPDGSFVYAIAPANTSTTISYTTPSSGMYKVAVYNVTSGRVNATGYYVK